MKPDEIERQFAAGDCILEVGGKARELYVLRSGAVRLSRESTGEGSLLGPGDLFGEVTAILGVPAAYRAVAEEETVLLAVDLPLLNRLCAENANFSFRLIRHLARELAGSLAEASALSSASKEVQQSGALARVAKAILSRAEGQGSLAPVLATLKDLADDAKLPMRETYEALHALLDKGHVRLVDDQLSLIERKLLEELT